jgi:L-lactate dehydrogenase
MDLQHAGAFLQGLVVMCDEEYELSANSDICIITAGVRQKVCGSRHGG